MKCIFLKQFCQVTDFVGAGNIHKEDFLDCKGKECPIFIDEQCSFYLFLTLSNAKNIIKCDNLFNKEKSDDRGTREVRKSAGNSNAKPANINTADKTDVSK